MERRAPGIGAKDIALSIIARIGADGAQGHAVEYAGAAVRALSMEGRLTLCNLSIEAGARCGMVAPDETTIVYLRGRPFAPAGEAFERAAADWLALASDADAAFDREVALDGAEIAPVVTWGVSPEDALPIDGVVPDPERAADPGKAAQIRDALAYMDLAPGQQSDGDPRRPRLHRLLHQQPHRGSARRRRGARRTQGAGARAWSRPAPRS